MKACLQLQKLFCSREDHLATRLIQQNEKSTQNFVYHNLVLCGQLNLIARSVTQLTIKHNIIQDKEGH